MNNLPPKCKQVFSMSRLDQLSNKEIASLLDISIKTVEAQITKALKIFRNKSIGFKNKPKEFDAKKYIKDNVDDIINEIKNELN